MMRRRRVQIISQTSDSDDSNLMSKFRQSVASDDNEGDDGDGSLFANNKHILRFLRGGGVDDEDDFARRRLVQKLKHITFLLLVIAISGIIDSVQSNIPQSISWLFGRVTEMVDESAASNSTSIFATTHQSLFTALFLFYAILALFSSRINFLFPDHLKRIISANFFLLKLALYIGILYLMAHSAWKGTLNLEKWLTVQNYIFYVCSALYMFIQSIAIIDLLYKWNRAWLREDDTWHDFLLVAFSATFIILSFVFILLLIYFADSFICYLIIGCALFCALIYIPLSIYVEHGSLFVSSGIMLYSLFLCYVTLGNRNRVGTTGTSILSSITLFTDSWIQYLTNFFFSSLFIIYCCLFLDSHFSGIISLVKGSWSDEDIEDYEEEDDRSTLTIFYLFMMLVTSFTYLIKYQVTQQQDAGTTASMGSGAIAKLGLTFGTIMLYSWSLVAPFVLQDREFA